MSREVKIEIRDSDNGLEGTLDVGNSEDFPMSFNREYFNIEELDVRGGEWSFDFDVPDTKNNNDLLDHLYHTNQKNQRDLMGDKDAVVLVHDVQLTKGKLRIEKTSANLDGRTYTLTYFGDSMAWAKPLSDKTMADLPWESTITYDYSTVQNSWSADRTTSEYFFSYIDRGGSRLGDFAAHTEDFLPDINIFMFYKRALNSVGYDVESNFLQTTPGSKYLVPFFGSNFCIPKDERDLNFVRTALDSTTSYTKVFPANPLVQNQLYELALDESSNRTDWVQTPAWLQDFGSNHDDTKFIAPRAADYRWRVKHDITIDVSGTAANYVLGTFKVRIDRAAGGTEYFNVNQSAAAL